MRKPVILIDNGHGENTPGKRSPDGVFREWSWCRDVAGIVVDTLKAKGYSAVLLVPEDTDVPLKERTKRVKGYTDRLGGNGAICVSIHVNAAGDGRSWTDARGWSVYTYTSPLPSSVRLAEMLFDQAVTKDFTVRKPEPGVKFWRRNLAICREPVCPSVLIEHFFMDNRYDLRYLLSPGSIYECADVICRGVIKFIEDGR